MTVPTMKLPVILRVESTGHKPTERERTLDGLRHLADRVQSDAKRLWILIEELQEAQSLIERLRAWIADERDEQRKCLIDDIAIVRGLTFGRADLEGELTAFDAETDRILGRQT